VILVVLRIHLEDLRIMSEFLFVGDPCLIEGAFLMVLIFQVKVDCADIVVVNSVFNVIEVLVGHGHADLTQLVNQFLLGVLLLVSEQFVSVVHYFSEGLLSLIFVNLGQLLHFLMVLTDEMLFFLGQISQVMSRVSGPNLSAWHDCPCWNNSTCSHQGEALNYGSFTNSCSHPNI
jgi:hypothetical protein